MKSEFERIRTNLANDYNMTLTPKQFSLLATKEDLKDLVTKDELSKAKNEILTSNDKLSKKLDNIEHAFVSNLAAHDRFKKRLTRTEKRLELKPMFDY